MASFTATERKQLEAFSRLTYCNVFLPERIEYEQTLLGKRFVATPEVWSRHPDEPEGERANVSLLKEKAKALLDTLREKCLTQGEPSKEEQALYQDLVLFHLYHHCSQDFQEVIVRPRRGGGQGEPIAFWPAFQKEGLHYLALPGLDLSNQADLPHLFACFFHIRRAFHHIFSKVIGGSMATARLRAAVWQSIFTADLVRYRNVFFDRMADFTTLITGPSGTGKELVAQAIGNARYISFDPTSQSFTADFDGTFRTLNIAALSPTLVESELFGHRKGAFTGATRDHVGWFESSGESDTILLDEIGELDPAIQVKLLRVLQNRTFQRLGETRPRHFRGKIIAATNRNLAEERRAGRFRDDLYYRLCSDLISTPSLRECLDHHPQELDALVRHILKGVTGRLDPHGLDSLCTQVLTQIHRDLTVEYPWPGNMRELEQCVRNILIRGRYTPEPSFNGDHLHRLQAGLTDRTLTADELLGRYAAHLYEQVGSYEAVARRLQVDRRTAKRRIEEWRHNEPHA
ncbi:MAG: sigma 54-interacting transcriptional regulator [Planctomycetota bacterium]|jgi:transcriptional regulator with AAA-type ATPase domain